MNKRIWQGFAFAALVESAIACAGQGDQGREAQSPLDLQTEQANHECQGSVCGPKALMAGWTFEPTQTSSEPVPVYARLECLGSVCGPMTTQPATWILPDATLQCAASVCGPRTMAAVRESEFPQSAWNQTSSCTTRE